MFFLMGIEDRSKALPYKDDKIHVCKACGKPCSYEVMVKYTVLTIFFIPVFKWNKLYFAKASCCQSVFNLSKETGENIYAGRADRIKDTDILYNGDSDFYKHCSFCNYESPYQYNYCPRCGHKYQR